MNDNVRAKMIEILEVCISRGEKLGYEDEDYRELLDGLRCTCLTYNGSILAQNSDCPTHARAREGGET